MKIQLVLSLFVSTLLHAQPQLGVYDYNQTFTSAGNMAYEEIWDWWNTCDSPGWLLPQLQVIESRGRIPIVTVEPWAINGIGTDATILQDIIAGKYDNVVVIIANDISAFGAPVIVRFAHEMESGRYPWSKQSPSLYISAFQRVSFVFKAQASNVQMLWSPVGDPGCQAYYPGSATDYVGCSVFEYKPYDIAIFGSPQSFKQVMDEKYPRLDGFDKPIFVAECGVSKKDNQRAWVAGMRAVDSGYALLTAIVYFNAKDSVVWSPAGVPNFSISPSIF